MKVVIVNEGLAYPPTGGNWLRTLNLMLPLAARHEITYVCRGSQNPDDVERAREFYTAHGIRVLISNDAPPQKRGWRFHARLGLNLLSRFPYSIASHRSRAVRQIVRRLAADERIDLWQFEALSYADAVEAGSVRTLVMAHNVESLIWQRLYETEQARARRWYIGHQWRKYEHYERRILRNADRVVAVSEPDAALMRERFGVTRVSVIDNGVDVARYSAFDRSAPDPWEILFLGSLDWRPNLDSIEVLLSSIMPRVVASEPRARLSIVGRNPPAALVRRVETHPWAALHANVADVGPYLARAGNLAVPLRIGGGSRLKILEAVAARLPVVSTAIGAEGLLFTPGRDIVVVENELQMAAALIEAIRNPEAAAARARRAHTVVASHYDWSRLAKELEAVWYATASASQRESEPVLRG